jgi:hypothetical protein
MPDAPYQQYPEPFKIIPRCKAVKYLNVAVVTGSPSEVEDPQ